MAETPPTIIAARASFSTNRKNSLSSLLVDIPVLPAGTYHLSQDTDDVVFLEEAPEHMRKVTNRDNPIALDDTDDEDDHEAGPSTAITHPSNNNKRERSLSPASHENELLEAALRESLANANGQSGPSTKRARIEQSTAADFLPDVLEVLPDIDVKSALSHLQQQMDAGFLADCAERVISLMFDMDGGYPKARETGISDGGSGKGKNKEGQHDAIPEQYADKIFRFQHRCGPGYHKLCYDELSDKFPRISMV